MLGPAVSLLAILSLTTFQGQTLINPRTDLQVTNSKGFVIPPDASLRSEATLAGGRLTATLCLLKHEVGPVLDEALGRGFDVLALQNRLLGEQPAVAFLTLSRPGEDAASYRALLAKLGTPPPIEEGMKRTGQEPPIDWKAVGSALGQPLQPNANGVASASLKGGAVGLSLYGCKCGKTMLLARASLPVSDVTQTIRRARAGGLLPTAICRIGEKFRVDFEGEGDAVQLARAVSNL